MLRFDIYVPDSHVSRVKEAIFEARGGELGNYCRCCSTVECTSQFQAVGSASPFIGELNRDTHVSETILQFVCQEKYKSDVLEAIKRSHPYETPSYEFWKVNAD